jgi:hypothetical protein
MAYFGPELFFPKQTKTCVIANRFFSATVAQIRIKKSKKKQNQVQFRIGAKNANLFRNKNVIFSRQKS